MSTVVGIECPDGVLLAGDRLLVADGRIRSQTKQHVFDFDSVGTAAVGSASDIDDYADQLDADLRAYRLDRGDVHIDALTRLASSLAEAVGVDAVVAAPDDDGVPRMRAIDRAGAVFDDPLAAFGSGAQLALGSLDGETDRPLDDLTDVVRGVFDSVAERDPGTGADVDIWTARR